MDSNSEPWCEASGFDVYNLLIYDKYFSHYHITMNSLCQQKWFSAGISWRSSPNTEKIKILKHAVLFGV